ncbi:hypothetical protein NC652_029712 [Populus alba x Populus x berolinensis]|nr:hypothetical protein NC652_029712 [Populus alba x Populus x berolinensis]
MKLLGCRAVIFTTDIVSPWPQESNTCSWWRYELVGAPVENNSFTLPRRGYVPTGRNFSCARPWQQHAYFSTSSPPFTWRGSN